MNPSDELKTASADAGFVPSGDGTGGRAGSKRMVVMLYAVLMMLGAVFGLGKNIVFAKVLGAEGLGYFSVMVLISTYGIYACNWGITNGLVRELSLLRGRGDESGARDLRNASAGGILIIAAFSFVVYGAVVGIWPLHDGSMRLTLLGAGIYTVATSFFLFATMELRTRLLTVPFALAMALKSGVSLLLGWLAARLIGFQGVIGAEILVSIGLFAFVRKYWIRDLKFVFTRLRSLYPVARIGFPLMLANFVRNAAISLDRWFVVALFSVALMGQYSFAMLVATAGMVLLNIVDVYLGPVLIHEFSRTGDLKRLFKKIGLVSLGVLVLFAAGWMPFVWVVGLVVGRYFPEYEIGIALMKIVYIGTMFQIMNLFDLTLLAVGHTRQIFIIAVGASLLSLAACLVCYYLKGPLGWFAAVYSLGRLVHLILSASWAWRTVGRWDAVKR